MKSTLINSRSWNLFLWLFICNSLIACHAEIENEHSEGVDRNAAEVIAFPSMKKHATLENWKVFEVNREIIATPSDWTGQLVSSTFTITPPNNVDTKEGLKFTRLAKDSPDLNYEDFGNKLANLAFKGFSVFRGDTIKKLEFRKNFGYERNVGLFKNGTNYRGYFLVYIDELSVYEYEIVLSSKRLKDYKGSLIKDIIGNLQINNQYLVSDENPLKQVLYIKQE